MSDHTMTANGAIAYSSTQNVFVDFFVMLVRNIETSMIQKYMAECWSQDPVKTIAIVFNARDRQNGKKEKNISNRCMIWLKKHKYQSYVKNLRTYVDKYGCWKDISYICMKTFHKIDLEVHMFAEQLKIDKQLLDNGKGTSISLCAKWASSEHDKYDVKECALAHKIAAKLSDDDKEIMKKYRKNYLTPLRDQIDIVESYMTFNRWSDINYERVPSVATKRLKEAFRRHDPIGYEKYLQQVASGTRKINVTGILPHELVNHYLKQSLYDETIELQWKTILNNMLSSTKKRKMVPIVDVSGSMYSQCGDIRPVDVSIALGLLFASCTSGYFANKVISFHSKPSVCEVKGKTLHEQVQNISQIPAGLNTNFEAVFDLLINAGLMFNIPSEEMPDTVVVLSDMQYDAADYNLNENTLHNTIVEKYSGTPYTPPRFIYWNLSASYGETFPVKAVSNNVAMVSGFSEQLLKVIMETDDINPENVLNEILAPYIPNVIVDSSER